MRKFGGVLLVGLVSFSFPTNIVSQIQNAVRFERPFGLGALEGTPVRRTVGDTIRILGLMVEFQTDSDPRTSGDGRFQMNATTARMIDPPPHDSLYFLYKLRFLENYYRKVSNGQLIVRGDIAGRVTLSKQMNQYTPDGSSLKGLAELVVESWSKADSVLAGFPFASYDAFIIFHAGVGRDINIVSLLGYDPTPSDLPSLYMSLPSLRKALNNPSFVGVPVADGTFRINHSMILPETETRIITSGSRTDTLQLGMNGLLAASFGSYLGLPDLFNTRTGQSGIGQFGLMDGAGIFAYYGLFPPEPSAWEKIFLGWTTPIEITTSSATLEIPAVGLTAVGQDTIYKIPISAREYFLVENRNRDPQGNGQRITIYENGTVTQKVFLSDSANFSFDNVRGISGSVIDVEDFDWALAGKKSLGYAFEGGGILIWHIDEERIWRGLVDNTVNADPERRGVHLEEADGSQDIGQEYEFLSAGSGTQSGYPLDAWFSGNPAPPYRNMFSETTNPNSNSNAGARTLITIKDFSRRSPRMTFAVEIGNAQLQKLPAFTRTLLPAGITLPPTISSSGIFLASSSGVYAFQPSGDSKTLSASGLISAVGSQFTPAHAIISSGNELLVGARDSLLYLWTLRDLTNDAIYDSIATSVVTLPGAISAPPVIVDSSGTMLVIVGDINGRITHLSITGSIRATTSLAAAPITSLAVVSEGPTLALAAVSGGKVYSGSFSFTLSDATKAWKLAVGGSGNTATIYALEVGGRRVVGLDGSLGRKFDVLLPSGSITALSVSDINADGSKDLIVAAGNSLYALNSAGVILDGFPIWLPRGEELVSEPLIADIGDEPGREIAVMTNLGVVRCYSARGALLAGFPLQISVRGGGHLSLFSTANTKLGFLAVSDSGSVAAWELDRVVNSSTIVWGQFHRTPGRSNRNDVAESFAAPVTEFFPKSRVYNWPNPVYGSTTQIRFWCAKDASVKVQVFDLAGNKITELIGRALAGLDSEITWDVSGIDSGVYLARVEANAGGQSEAAIIKIAVVK